MPKFSDSDAACLKRLGTLLKRRREELDLSQSDVAEKVGVGQEIVSRWERGFAEMGWLSLSRLLRTLDIPCEDAMRCGCGNSS